jgi:two-component system KDP operon response regulator KdpE
MAAGVKEALKTIECQKPDMMVLDIFMPQMDGFEVLTQLRSSCQMPVIAVSAQTSAAQKALSLGANNFVAKPFRPAELL